METSRKTAKTQVLLGAHFSIAGGLENALKEATHYGCRVCQIFTQNANTWKERILSETEIATFREHQKIAQVSTVVSHSIYLINPASPNEETAERSRMALIAEMHRAKALDLAGVVLHPGAHMGEGETAGLRKVIDMVRAVLAETPPGPTLLLETTAGQGTNLGHTFEQLADLMAGIDAPDRMGICLDTAHIFAAGYDIRTPETYEDTLAKFDRVIGLDRLHLIHLNDSAKALGTRVDRHTHIGEGEIGLEAFRLIMNDPKLAHIPKILETPKEKDKDWDAVNLQLLRRLTLRHHIPIDTFQEDR